MPLNINTILTVLGTVFGAYFGAKVAGKYAVDSVEKHIESNERHEMERVKKTITILKTEIHTFKYNLELFMGLANDKNITLSQQYDMVTIIVKNRADKLENTLLSIDWMYLPLDEFIMIASIKEIINNMLTDIGYLEENNQSYLVFRQAISNWDSYSNDLKSIESRLKELI